MNIYLSNGQEVTLEAELGRGGEGVIHTVARRPDEVAKIWHQPEAGSSRSSAQARDRADAGAKLQAMLENPPSLDGAVAGLDAPDQPAVIWPTAALYDDRKQLVGFLMPRVDYGKFAPCFRYFNPAERRELEGERRRTYGPRDMLTLARNLAAAVGRIHDAGYVIGDINENNILVDDAMHVAIVDADSFQVKHQGQTWRSTKGREDYTPPRLQGLRFREHDRTRNDDNFGLAVLLFKIIMHGVHPYASTSNPNNENAVTALGEKIKLEYFPYNESGRTPPEHQPSQSYRQAWQDIDFDLRHLFRRAFDPDATANRQRPEPQEWVATLGQVLPYVPREWPKPRQRPAPARSAPQQRGRNRQQQTPRPPRNQGQGSRRQQAQAQPLGARSGVQATATASNPMQWYQQLSNDAKLFVMMFMVVCLMVVGTIGLQAFVDYPEPVQTLETPTETPAENAEGEGEAEPEPDDGETPGDDAPGGDAPADDAPGGNAPAGDAGGGELP